MRALLILGYFFLLLQANQAQDSLFAFDYLMASLSGDCFMMGCDDERDGYGGFCNEDLPLEENCVKAFKIGRYEVTQAQWISVMGTNPSYFQPANEEAACLDCPVEMVNAEMIEAFLRKLNQKTGKNYRLPTEAEWEFAARGGSLAKGYRVANVRDLYRVAWFNRNSENKTHPVGKKKPNGLGLFDMLGNVEEWCSDLLPDNNYQIRGNVRGGSWFQNGGICHVAERFSYRPSDQHYLVGFRLVLEE